MNEELLELRENLSKNNIVNEDIMKDLKEKDYLVFLIYLTLIYKYVRNKRIWRK
jgi:hypothetical protein